MISAFAVSSLTAFPRSPWRELTWSAAEVDGAQMDFRVGVTASGVAGFYALDFAGDEPELEALFVEPDRIGQGIGRDLMTHAKKTAGASGADSLVIQGDPNATAFYRAAGASQFGERESASIAGRALPLFRIDLSRN